ncbi:NPC intracellular cholesterol transporter 2-like [Glandiceps talaboti]
MIVKSTLILVFLVAIATVESKRIVNLKDCASGPPGKGAIKSLDLTPCVAEPCKFKKGINATVTVDFIAGENATAAKGAVTGIIADVPVPFPLPHPNACGESLKCPLSEGVAYRYVAILPVKDYYPTLEVVVQWELQDEKDKDLFCFQVPISIV